MQRSSMSRGCTLMLFLAALVLLPVAVGVAQDKAPANAQLQDFDELEQDLDWVRWLLDHSRINEKELDRIRGRINAIVDRAKEAAPKAAEKVDSLDMQLKALGEPPPDETGKESTEIVKRRNELEERLAEQKGHLQRVDLIETRAKELLSSIAERESRATAKEIFSRDATVFHDTLWETAGEQARTVPRKVVTLGISAFSQRGLDYYLLAIVIVLGITLLARKLVLRSVFPRFDEDQSRYVSALLVLIANGFLPAVGLIIAFVPLLGSDTIDDSQTRLVESVLAAGAALLVARAWIHVALFSYESPRLIILDDSIARSLTYRLYALTGITILSFFLYQMGRANIMEPEIYRCTQLILRISITVLFLYMLPMIRRATDRTHETEGSSSTQVIQGMYGMLFFTARVVVPSVVVVNPFLLAYGYWRLSDWLFFGVVGSCLLLLTLWLIRNSLRELVSLGLDKLQSSAPDSSALVGTARSGIVWSIGLANLALWMGTILSLLVIWGVPASQVKTWTNAFLFTDIKISRIEISAFDILMAIGVFLLLLFLTRTVQNQLQKKVFSWAPLDIGLRNALWSATGYIGITAAIIASLLALGINLSQLFLILGALSVGIGFGLQSVVHDFASGLILLFERPVRIGDWITVDGEDGMVRRIGARVSLLKTPLDGDVWIPNSKLTSSNVINWTLSSHTGHIRIVSVLQGDTDESQAREIILKTVSEQAGVLDSPAPDIYLEHVDGESITLTLYAVMEDIADRFKVESDIRYALRAAFKEAGIEYAQQVRTATDNPVASKPIPGRYVSTRS